MSVVLASAPAAETPALRPGWLRPMALATIVAAHASALAFGWTQAASPPSLDSVEVALVPLGDAPQDQQAREEIEPQPEPPPPATPPQPAELSAPPPEQIAPQAPPLPLAKPKPVVKPKPRPVVDEDNTEPSPAQARRIQQRKREAAERRREAQEARQEARRGAAAGFERASGFLAANYAGQVIAELNRHKFYPAAARAAGASGSVGVAFTIGPSGRVISQSVIRSSGSAALDAAARDIMSAVSAPPPPGGRFSTRTNIRFNLD